MAEEVRYVYGGEADGSGRCCWVQAWVGFRQVGTFKGYTRKPEDNVITLYPYRITDPDLIKAEKKVLPLRELHMA